MVIQEYKKLLWRRQMLHDNEVPKPSEIRNLLGSPLSEIFFSTLDDQGKKVLGLKPEMKGPGRDLWVSPSDLLAGKVRLTVPMTRKCTRALTHKGILEMGTTALNFYEKQKEEEKRQAVIDAEIKTRVAEMEKCREAIRIAVEEQREKHDKEKEVLMEQFHDTIQEAMNVTKCHFEDQMKMTVQIERAEVANLMEDKIDFVLENQEVELIEQCKMEEMFRLSTLNKEYQDFLLENKQKMDEKLQGISDDYNFKLDEIYKKMENDKLSDISNAIKIEREHYATEIKELKKDFDNEITKFNTMIKEKQSEVQILEALAEKTSRNMKAWEGKAKLIFHEFQKFINFSMKAVPGQAEYLLSLEKLLAQELEQSIPEEETENVCMSHSKSRKDEVANVEISKAVLSDVLHEVYNKTDLNSCTVLFSTRVALVKILEGIYIFNEMNIKEKILHDVITFTFNISNIQHENDILITTLNELPTNMPISDLAYEIKHIIDEYTTKELLIRTILNMFEIFNENPSLDVMNKILDGIYSSEDMYPCKDTLIKILTRVYQHLDVLPLNEILKVLLWKVYEMTDLYFGRRILLMILNTVYTPELQPEKCDLVKIIVTIYKSADSHPVKSNLIEVITKTHKSDLLDDDVIVTNTHNINAKEKIIELFQNASEIKYEHPGKATLIGIVHKVYETNGNTYVKEILINIMEKVYQSLLVNPSKEVLFKIVDCIYKTTKPHHTKDILTEILESITKGDLIHPGKEMFLEILLKVKREISEKSLTKRNEIEEVVEGILQDVYKEGDMRGVLNEILEKISQEHIHPGRQILLDILRKADLMQPPLKRGNLIYASVQDIITRIIDGINKAENAFSSHQIFNIVYETLEKVSISKSVCEQSEEIDAKSMDIINIIHEASLQPAISTIDGVIETVFQATENVERAIQEMKLAWKQDLSKETKVTSDDIMLEDNMRNHTKLSFKDRGLVGEGSTEYVGTSDEFLAKRLNALIKIFREHVSLTNLVIPSATLNKS